MAAFCTQEAAAVAVGVDIQHRLAGEFVGMRFHPFGRAKQPRLLAVPARVNDRPIGPPAGARECAQGLRFTHQRNLARERIARPEHPAVVVVAAHHPFVRVCRTRHHRDHIIDRLERPVGLDREVHLDRVGAPPVIGQRQSAPCSPADHRPVEPRHDLYRVTVRYRQRGNLKDCQCGLARQALGARCRTDAGSKWIARILRQVLNRATLDAGVRPAAAAREGITLAIAVVGRIRINQASDRTMLLRKLWLEPAPPAAVPREDDLSFDTDPAGGERLIIAGHAIVRVNHGRGNIAVTLIGHIWWQRALQIGAAGVLRNRRLLSAKHDPLG